MYFVYLLKLYSDLRSIDVGGIERKELWWGWDYVILVAMITPCGKYQFIFKKTTH